MIATKRKDSKLELFFGVNSFLKLVVLDPSRLVSGTVAACVRTSNTTFPPSLNSIPSIYFRDNLRKSIL